MIEISVDSGGEQYRVRAVKRGNSVRDNGEGATGIGEALVQLIVEGVAERGRQYKVAVLRERARDAAGIAPTKLQLLYLELLPKDADPEPRVDDLRDLVLKGHFDGWAGRRKSLL
ncbi:hypothetical protein ABEG17_05135 [Pedococcus sp. KACC 23699]|uniref:Uncharacterized protein n=1 Tax=Pedococcus sp. KACC 23699 TaxID=3149228 RepID=A0AAU7JWM9_9MICO